MWYAIDSATGTQVHAVDGSRYRQYCCPVCGGEVFLRSGQYRAAHFAHLHVTASRECEFYTPGQGPLNPQRRPERLGPSRAAHESRIPPAEVCIEVENRQSSRRARPPRWQLCLTIPKSLNGIGTITFDFGPTSKRTIALSKLSRSPQTYPADPDAAGYSAIWCSPDTNPAYRETISQRHPGLSTQGVSAFLSVPRRFKPRARRLQWGKAYFFVWPTSFDPKFPADFDLLPLEKNKSWACALTSLPTNHSETLLNWAKTACSAHVEYSSSTMSLLYPFLSVNGHDGRIEVPAVGSLIVRSVNRDGADHGRSKAASIVDGKNHEVLLPEESTSLVGFSYSKGTPASFDLSGNHEASFRFLPLRSHELREQPMVWGEFQSPAEGRSKVPLHSNAARQWLAAVRAGQASLERLILPQAVQGELAWRSGPIANWNRSCLNQRAARDRKHLQQITLPQDELDQVQAVLRSTLNEVRLSLPGFAEHYFSAVVPVPEATVCLTPELRSRILWLNKEIAFACGYWRPPIFETVSDHHLVRCFLDLTPPPSLTGHYRSICRSIDHQISTSKLDRTLR